MDLVRSRDLAEALVQSHAFRTETGIHALRGDPEAVEIVADVAYYANLEISYVWAYTLWRLQAVFEAIVTQSFLPSSAKRPIGFSAKLKAVKAAGFNLSQEDERALLDWARVRNQLSHEPEWYYHAEPITREDVHEYLALLLRILDDWKGGGEFLPYAPEFSEA